jgi:hypothetical protein
MSQDITEEVSIVDILFNDDCLDMTTESVFSLSYATHGRP